MLRLERETSDGVGMCLEIGRTISADVIFCVSGQYYFFLGGGGGGEN